MGTAPLWKNASKQGVCGMSKAMAQGCTVQRYNKANGKIGECRNRCKAGAGHEERWRNELYMGRVDQGRTGYRYRTDMTRVTHLLTQQVVRIWTAHRLRTTSSSPTSVMPSAEHALTAWVLAGREVLRWVGRGAGVGKQEGKVVTGRKAVRTVQQPAWMGRCWRARTARRGLSSLWGVQG